MIKLSKPTTEHMTNSNVRSPRLIMQQSHYVMRLVESYMKLGNLIYVSAVWAWYREGVDIFIEVSFDAACYFRAM